MCQRVLFFWACACAILSAATAQVPLHAAEPTKPALVVVVSIDQFKYEYLDRFQPNFAADGIFNRVRKEGAFYTNCNHAHAFTITAPGHSVMLTGTYPHNTGIIGNDWFSPASKEKDKKVYCVFDGDSPLIVGKGKGVSPKNLLVETVGDVLRRTTDNKARVFGVAVKDRAAVLMTGKHANAAYWFESPLGKWVSSTYYFKDGKLPKYLEELNSGDTVSRYGGKTWNLLYDESKYKLHYPDDAEFEGKPEKLGRAFPHQFVAAGEKELPDQIEVSPFGNEMTLAVAYRVLTAEQLGQRGVSDLLCINLSANDYIGHNYGPFSLEVEDITYHTDKFLGEFAHKVSQHLGERPWVLAITADHGVAPIPEYAKTVNLPGKRDPLGKLAEVQAKLEKALVAKLGELKGEKRYVQKTENNQVYLQRELPELKGKKFVQAQEIVRDTLAAYPDVASAVTRAELEGDKASDRKFFAQFKKAFHPELSGDVLYALQPYQIMGQTPATHGSPYEYDSHVPLILWGSGIKPGEYNRAVTPAMLAPTVAKLLGLPAPAQCEEQPLAELWESEKK